MYTEIEIKQLITGGENSSVEFKSSAVTSDSLAREIVAFANSSGGIVLIGVEDDGEITGLSPGKRYDEWAANIARNNVTPAVQVEYYEITIDNKRIAVIEVPKGKDKPYQTSDHRFLVRVGSTNRTATQAELMRLFQQSGVFHFDVTSAAGASIIDLNLAKINRYFNRYEIDFTRESETDRISLLKNTDILDEEGKATVAGLLVFGIDPQRYLLNAGISFAHFNGDDITAELIDKQNIDNTIDYQVDTTLSIIKNNLLQPSTITGT
ncbi:MAG: putative DNA binding domain-containing protein, partial [Candidatus Aminicenantes bacterium]|nr:putative DNA binding domain-containing protein [Candidatus Aminicenantes bacterium]